MTPSLFRRALCGTLLCSLVAAAAAADPLPELNATLAGTRWTLQTLGGEAQAQVAGGTPVQLKLDAASQHLSGHTGCNRLMGRFVQRGTLLTLSPLGTTRAACAEPAMKQEQAVLKMLREIDGYRVENRTLSLLQGEVVRATWGAPAPKAATGEVAPTTGRPKPAAP
jgi:heat shock protein HslJ